MRYNFGAQVHDIVQRTKIRMEDVMERVTLQIANDIIRATPVDVGTLRGNWFPAYDAPDLHHEDTPDPSGEVTATRMLASLSGNKLVGRRWYFTNSMPYAYKIEYEGWSKVKAPAGMVRISVTGVQEKLKEALR